MKRRLEFWKRKLQFCTRSGLLIAVAAALGLTTLAQGGDACQDPDAVITVEILTDNFGNETTWELVEQGVGVIASGGPYPNNTLITVDVPVCSTSCYNFTIFDSFGDGICCGFGIGFYNIFYEGNLVCSGGEFGDSETCADIGAGCVETCPDPDVVLTVEIMTDNFGNETTWEVVEEGVGVIFSGGPYPNNTLIIEEIDICSANCYNFTIFDSFGDGICCGFGIGFYNIYVDGNLVCSGGEFESEETCFNLTGAQDCEEPPGIPENDNCEDAIPLAVPAFVMGTTLLATPDEPPAFTCGTSVGAPGVWYSVIGTGTTMTATTCTNFFDYDTKISVFCGDCFGDLLCVGGNDDSCPDGASGLLSTVSWCSQVGAEYLILVHGFGGQTGDFELEVSENGVGCTADVQCLPAGACCFDDGSCVVTTEDDCAAQGGAYQGDDTDCGSTDYVVGTGGAFEDIAGTGTQIFLGDDAGAFVNIGFEFTFYGDTHNEVAIASNGYLTFSGDDLTDLSEDSIPNTNLPNNIIAMLWDDLDPGNAGSPATIHHQTLGVAPDRRFVVQFTDVPEFPNEGANTFQGVLFEGSNCVELRYVAITTGDFVAGVENQDGTDGVDVSGLVAEGVSISLCPETSGNPCEIVGVEVSLDIKPGSCPNSINRNSNGVLPVMIVGTADFDVGDIDVSSVLISRADGVGGAVAPFRSSADDDEATPFDGELCDCHELEGDGILDLGLKFVSNDVVAALQLNGLPNGDLVELVVSGNLLDGTSFEGSDCIRLVPPGTPPGMMSVESNVPKVFIDVAPLDQTLDGDGFTDFERTYSLGTIVTLTAPQTHPGWVFDRWDYDRGGFSGLTAPYLGGFGLQTVGRTIEIIILDGEFSLKAIYRLDEDH